MAERGAPSRLELAQLAAGDLPAEEAASLRSWLAQHPEHQRRLEELSQNAAAYDASGSALSALGARLAAPPEPAPPWWRRRWLWAPAAAALAAALVAAVWLPAAWRAAPSPSPEPGAAIRFKGTLGVRVVAKRGHRQWEVKQGDVLAAGDALRFVVTTAGPGYLTVLSLDGRGEASAFYPDTDPRRDPTPLRLARAGRHTLPGSVVLDDAPGPERLVVAFSSARFRRGEVHAKIADALRRGVAPGQAGLQIELLSVAKKGPRR